jgi:spore coat protein U-like protein
MRYGKTSGSWVIGICLVAIMAAGPAQAQRARIGGLVDVNFGTISATTTQSMRQNVAVCSYQGNPHRLNYSVTATGSGPGSAFTISTGAANLPYDVQWSDLPGQTGGTMLQPGVTASGFGNPETASLTVSLRAADLASASAGNYSGTLQITITPE